MLDRLRKARRCVEQAEAVHTTVAPRAMPSLARDALVAAINPDSGKLWNRAPYAVPGALLVELAREGRLEVSGTDKSVQVSVRDSKPLGNQELDDALSSIGSSVVGSKVIRLVSLVPQTEELLERLVAEGVIVEESDKRLGVFPVRRYRPTPSAGRDELVSRIRSALLGESVPDDRTVLLISVLVDVHLKLFVPRKSLGDAYRRADELLARLREDEQRIVAAVKVARDRDLNSGGDTAAT